MATAALTILTRMDVTIARWRLRNQHLSAPHADSATEVVNNLLAVQGENPSQSAWAVATRTAAPEAGDLAGLLATGQVLRTHVLRTTWHYVGRTDIDWLLALTGPTLQKITGTQLLRDSDLVQRDVDRLATAVLDSLSKTPDQTREELTIEAQDRVPELSERVTGRVTMLLVAHLELERLIVSGRPRGGEHTYAAYDVRVGLRVNAEAFDRDEALARIVLRYFTGHGPAPVKDLAYWATLTITDVRRGLDAVRDQLNSFEHDGRTFWHAPGEPPDEPADPAGHLLQLLDETYRGYQDSRWVVPRQRETAIGVALVDGQLVARMKRTLAPSSARFDLTPYRRLSGLERLALEEAATRYGEFLGRPAQVVGIG